MIYSGKYNYYNNWLLIEAEDSITAYYRELFRLHRFKTDKLFAPKHRSHITVISKYNEKPKEYYERKYHGVEVEFDLKIDEAFDDGTYVYMTVECPHAQMIRNELGLGLPFYPFHLTIGNRK